MDIYSFGMCALEVSVEHLAVGQRENEFEERRWLCADAVVVGGLVW